MHILHIYKDYYPVFGGIEQHLRLLAEGLAARGHQVTVLVTSLDRATSTERPLPNLTVIRAARLTHAASTPISPAMLQIARTLRPDVVHLQFPFPPGDLAALAVPGRPPLLVSYQSDIVRQRRLLQLYRPLQRLTLRRAALILTSNPAYIASSAVLRPLAHKCRVLPLGIDTARFAARDPAADARIGALLAQHQIPTNTPVVLFVGRLRYYKGLHILLEALARLWRQRADPPLLLLAGTGPEATRLRQQVLDLHIDHLVRWLGDVADEDLPALYRRAQVFVLPAQLRAEAFGLVLAEALASGVPCISTELGTGTSYVNAHGQTGLVVPPADPAALADAIGRLLAEPALRARYGAAGRARVAERFSADRMVLSAEQIYAAALRG